MTRDPVVSNSSVLISLHQIGQLDLLARLFTTVIIPPTVAVPPLWMLEQSLKRGLDRRVLGASLDPGETDAIGSALEVAANFILLDERPARRLARRLRLPVIGTLGILARAKEHGLLASIRPSLDVLPAVEFYVTREFYEQVLVDAGEATKSVATE